MQTLVVVKESDLTQNMVEQSFNGKVDKYLPSSQVVIRIKDIPTDIYRHYIRYSPESLKLEIAKQEDEEGEFTGYVIPSIKDVEIREMLPFSSKKNADGKGLFRRKHGVFFTAKKGETTKKFTVPYDVCHIDQIEIIGCELMDSVDLLVVHPLYGVLDKFGYDVMLPEQFYSDKSNYDAKLFKGLEIHIVYKNAYHDKGIGINYVLHEVK